MMLVEPIPLYPRKRRVKPRTTAAVPVPPPAERPVLVAAAFDADALMLTLQFDRDVNGDALLGNDITVDDPIFTGWRYDGTGNTQLSAGAVVVVAMEQTDPIQQGDQVLLNAGPSNGIVAAADGLMWDGVAGVALPFEQTAKTKTPATRRAKGRTAKRSAA